MLPVMLFTSHRLCRGRGHRSFGREGPRLWRVLRQTMICSKSCGFASSWYSSTAVHFIAQQTCKNGGLILVRSETRAERSTSVGHVPCDESVHSFSSKAVHTPNVRRTQQIKSKQAAYIQKTKNAFGLSGVVAGRQHLPPSSSKLYTKYSWAIYSSTCSSTAAAECPWGLGP